ncbi:hypothetical protein CALVIDRAFT_220341 [Calocera viscosa TUFC12733]|uniref:Secreted protein n=1 Tax=Calocera viscosa (strain TUFC12733) TaxID=1330018 RepID=A0A167RJJ6_CALVF|nr:hypothetical protein CALVIDRAFT_220341 [Calocera viscosa TUFC12733]
MHLGLALPMFSLLLLTSSSALHVLRSYCRLLGSSELFPPLPGAKHWRGTQQQMGASPTADKCGQLEMQMNEPQLYYKNSALADAGFVLYMHWQPSKPRDSPIGCGVR